MLDMIAANWDAGGVDVRTLRDVLNSFEDTCRYLLKEKKPQNERSYRTSRNLKRPEEPLRRKVPESQMGEVPPGVEPVQMVLNGSNPYGRYYILIGTITDQQAFDRYWSRAKADKRHAEERRNWKKYAKKNAKN